MEIFDKIVLCFAIVGAINWGLVGLLDFNLVTFLFKEGTLITRIIYSIIGIAGILSIKQLFIKTMK